jgi:hypothetical protein
VDTGDVHVVTVFSEETDEHSVIRGGREHRKQR